MALPFIPPAPRLVLACRMLAVLALAGVVGCRGEEGPGVSERGARQPQVATPVVASATPSVVPQVPARGEASRIVRLPPPDPLGESPSVLVDSEPPTLAGPAPEGTSAPTTEPAPAAAMVLPSDAVEARIAPLVERAFEAEEYDEDAEAAARASVDDLLAYYPAERELSTQLRSEVQQAFSLARNGALHAAKERFEELLGEMARTKDASRMTSRYSRSLAAGLRALREADDFENLTGDRKGDVLAIAAGHQTPMLHGAGLEWTLPHEAVAMYHRYAERKLAAAVEGEQAGSMMLFGLGKLHQQMAARRDNVPQALRKGLTFHRAAVLTHGGNHLAANEAGVLLARAGRYSQARPWLEQAAVQSQSSVTYRNLAYVCQKMGDTPGAQQHDLHAHQLASREMSQGQMSAERGITWVAPQDFNRMSGAAPVGGAPPAASGSEAVAHRGTPGANAPAPPSPTPRSRWR